MNGPRSVDAMADSLLTPLSAPSPAMQAAVTQQASAPLPPAAPPAPPPMAAGASSATFTAGVSSAASGTHSSMAEGMSAGVMMGGVAEGVAAGVVSAPPAEAARTHAAPMAAPPTGLPTHGSASGSAAHTASAVVTGGTANSSVTAESVLQEAIALPAGERVLFFNDLRLHLHREGLLSVRNRAKKQRVNGAGPGTAVGAPPPASVQVGAQEGAPVGRAPVGSAPVGSAPVSAATVGPAHSHSATIDADAVGRVVSSSAAPGAAVGRPGPPPLGAYGAAVTSTPVAASPAQPVMSGPIAGLEQAAAALPAATAAPST
jgi:hypothetical protein|eukprot:COSAG06_NODE_485_length_15117_cov_5.922493_14_plen_317_part_00